MPTNHRDANVWFYQDFLGNADAKLFWMEKPEDWARLQVWDGTSLKPAMGQGFHGMPTDEQVEKLFAHAKNGQLLFFELGNTTPKLLESTGLLNFDLNPQMPVAPEKPGPNASNTENAKYANALFRYEKYIENYNRSVAALEKLGEGIKAAVDAYNSDRDLEQENIQVDVIEENFISRRKVVNREKADRVITDVFGPKFIASPDIFYSEGHPAPNAVFTYDSHEKMFAPNAFELPQNDKLTEYDVATINLAMLGAKNPVQEHMVKQGKTGPLAAEYQATNGFHMMITGLFGESRKSQTFEKLECIDDVLKQSKSVIDAYLRGETEPLGRHLGECVRNIKHAFTGATQDSLTQDMVAATMLIQRLQNLLNKDPALMQASGLQEADLEFMRGYLQMGKVYDNYLQSNQKSNEARIKGQALTVEEKAEILADAVIRRMVEKEFAKDKEKFESDDAYQQGLMEAVAKDAVTNEAYDRWKVEELPKLGKEEGSRASEKYIDLYDINMNAALFVEQPAEHRIISLLATDGMLERLRQNLKQDPAILEEAAKENIELDRQALFHSADLDALVSKTESLLEYSAITDAQKQAWFNNMKAAVAGGDDLNAASPWLSAAVETDAGRLVIAVPNDAGGKNMVPLASLLEGGLQALENPDPKAIDLMYRNAMEGNLYYYQVGKNMPQRVSAEGEKAPTEQLRERPAPNAWQRFWHFVTGGRAYADIYKPMPDRDPAAMESILQGRTARADAITDEVAAHQQIQNALPEQNEQELENTQIMESADARYQREVNTFCRVPGSNAQRDFPHYDANEVYNKLDEQLSADTGEGDALNREKATVKSFVARAIYTVDADPEMIRQAMAAAVLLEAIKQEHMAGKDTPLREQFNQDRNATVNGMANNEVFKAFTEGANNDMLMHFVMVGGAKNMYQAIQASASMHANNRPEAQANNLELSNQKSEANNFLEQPPMG